MENKKTFLDLFRLRARGMLCVTVLRQISIYKVIFPLNYKKIYQIRVGAAILARFNIIRPFF